MSTGDDPDQLRRLFEACCTAAPLERASLLARARATDPALVAEVEAMLRHHDSDAGVLDRPPAALAAGSWESRPPESERAPAGALPPGTRFGRYMIGPLLGYGGMGVVYEAEQDSPRRLVALKLIRSELVSPSLLRRFEHEAAALGMLQHPGIAQVYEAGTAEVGGSLRPFIAMELLRGESITAYVRKNGLGVAEIARLAAQVADAVEHAHQRGVIHRDLKPANIVVTPEGTPKILDFGVARLAAAQDEPGATLAGQIIGTLGYLAPEQALGNPASVDARCDVYALGVILYELIAGRHPAPESGSSLREAVMSLEQGVLRPPSAFAPLAHGDLDTIVMHALAPDPARRYQHAADLATDLRNLLSDRPILARRPSVAYLARKFAARNRLGVAAGAAVTVALAVGVVGLAVGMVRAQTQARRAERVNLYLRSMLTLDSHQLVGRDRSLLKAMLDQALSKLSRIDDDPAAQDAIRAVVGNAYAEFGYPNEGLKFLPEVAQRQKDRWGEDHPDAMFASDALAHCLLISGRYADALPVLESLHAIRKRVNGQTAEATETTLNNLIMALRAERQEDRALALAQQLYDQRWAARGPEDPQTLHALMTLGGIYSGKGDAEKAEPLLRQARDAIARTRGERAPEAIIADIGWCEFLYKSGRYREYIPEASRVWPVGLEVMGDNYGPVLSMMQQLAVVLEKEDRTAEAGPVYERILTIQPRLYPDHPNTLALYANAALHFNVMGDSARAAALCQEALTTLDRIKPDADTLRADLLGRRGGYLLAAGDAAGAEAEFDRACNLLKTQFPPDYEAIAAATQGRQRARAAQLSKSPAEAE